MDKESKNVALFITLIATAIFLGAALFPESEIFEQFIRKLAFLGALVFLMASIYATIKALNQTSKSLQTLEKIETNQKKIIFLLQKSIENKQQ